MNNNSDAENALEEARALLCTTDRLLEPGIVTSLRQFVHLKGKPEEAIRHLSENYKGFAQMVNLMVEWLKLCGKSDENITNSIESYIRELVLTTFDPMVADRFFVTLYDSTPEWLEQMINQRSWRALICELSEKHPNCNLLDMAIRRISDAGYQSEIATVASASASTYIEVFNRVLVDMLKGIITQKNYDVPENSLADLSKLICSSSNTYLYSQALLCGLEKSEEKGHLLRYVIQEVMQAARAQNRNVDRYMLLLSGAARFPQVAIALLSILGSRKLQSGDISALFQQYSSNNPPPVELIRLPELFDLFTKTLFNFNKPIPHNNKAKYIYVLSCMASIKQANDRTELKPTIGLLDSTMTICLKNEIRYQSKMDLSKLIRAMDCPIVSACLINWIGYNLEEPGYFQLEYATTRSVPIHLALLDQIAIKHTLLHSKIFELLDVVMNLETQLEPILSMDLKRIFIDRMIHLISLGYVTETLKYWKQKAKEQSVEPSLLRYFVCEFIRMIGPPYHHRTIECIASISSFFSRALDNEESTTLLRDFFSDCEETNLSPAEAEIVKQQTRRVGG